MVSCVVQCACVSCAVCGWVLCVKVGVVCGWVLCVKVGVVCEGGCGVWWVWMGVV